MSTELLKYYNRELAYLRKLGAEFSAAHPGVAANLGIGAEGENDPFVGRLVEAVAFLNARTRLKIEDDFPEVSSAMLDVLYPHYQRPIPSSAIVQFQLDTGQADRLDGHAIRRKSQIRSEPVDGTPCQFHTCFDVTCWPIKITAAKLEGQPISAPQTSFSAKSAGALCLEITGFSEDFPLSELSLGTLRAFLRLQAPFSFDLYELLMNHVLGVAMVDAQGSPDRHTLLEPDAIQPVGFAPDEGLVDYPAQSFLGYRLLSEYFACPEKFLFFDLQLGSKLKSVKSRQARIYFYLDRHLPELELQVSKDTFALGCTPIVNLFQHRAEAIRLTQMNTEYPLVPDARRPAAYEVYSIDRVVGTARGEEPLEFAPFYSVKHERDAASQRAFWHSVRRGAPRRRGAADPGTDLWLSFVDLDFKTIERTDWTVDVETTCLNRNLPSRLPFGGDRPHLQYEGEGVVTVKCVTAPTPALRPPLEHGNRWRLLSHLNLNHLSLAESKEGCEALREILRLYDFQDSSETARNIEGVVGLQSQPIASRVPGPMASVICRGLEIRLKLDDEAFTSGGRYLFASVLEHFFGLYASINSFTQTVLVGSQDQEIRRWPPRAGQLVLL